MRSTTVRMAGLAGMGLAAAITQAGWSLDAAPSGPPLGIDRDIDLAKRLCRTRDTDAAANADSLFGHHVFRGAAPGDLVAVPRGFASGTCTRLHGDAAGGLRALLAAAQAEEPAIGRDLVGLSCHRSVARQAALYCRPDQIARRGHAGHARWVAPPGFSEHATGLAIDFGARSSPACHLEFCFASTRAGRWLAMNAPRFGFELSFPEGNPQGVVFEPWHFRYVGHERARAVFVRPADPADQRADGGAIATPP